MPDLAFVKNGKVQQVWKNGRYHSLVERLDNKLVRHGPDKIQKWVNDSRMTAELIEKWGLYQIEYAPSLVNAFKRTTTAPVKDWIIEEAKVIAPTVTKYIELSTAYDLLTERINRQRDMRKGHGGAIIWDAENETRLVTPTVLTASMYTCTLDTETRENIDVYRTVPENEFPVDFSWRFDENVNVPMTFAHFRKFSRACIQYGQDVYTASWAHKAAFANLQTVEDFELYYQNNMGDLWPLLPRELVMEE